MATLVTPEKIAAMSTEGRAMLYANCMKTVDNEDAIFIVETIVESGMPYASKKQMSHQDPEMKAIETIVNARVNEKAIVNAAESDMPPLSVIEPQIVKKLGNLYRAENGGTVVAGYLLAKRLYELDYEKCPPKMMPEGSVSRTGATFRKKPGYA